MNVLLDIRQLRLCFGAQTVLAGINLYVRAGELVGLIGPNGSGKSSLLRCVAGLSAIDSGEITVAGHDLRTNLLAARAVLGYAVELAQLPSLLRGRQALELVAQARHLDVVPESSRAFAERLALTPWLEKPIGTYSLGTRQKLAIVLALLGDPPVLLFDEVPNGLDPLAAFACKQIMRDCVDAGAAVVLATHGLEVAERFLDRAVLLLDGRIAADWGQNDLRRFRTEGNGSLEQAVVELLLQRQEAQSGGLPPPKFPAEATSFGQLSSRRRRK